MLKKKITIINKLGLHARAAAKLITVAGRFSSDILIRRVDQNDQHGNGKSIIEVMVLAITQGTEIELIINGADEDAAFAEIAALINNRFGESE